MYGEYTSPIYRKHATIVWMRRKVIRITLDISTPLYRRIEKQVAAQGHSVSELILAGVKAMLMEQKRPRTKRVHFPLIVSEGSKVNLSNERIHKLVEFP